MRTGSYDYVVDRVDFLYIAKALALPSSAMVSAVTLCGQATIIVHAHARSHDTMLRPAFET